MPISENGTDCKEIIMAIQSTQTNKKYFNEWAKDKSPLLAIASFTLAGSAKDTLEFLQKYKSNMLNEKILFLPPINQWINLYRNHRKLYKGVTSALRAIDSKTSDIVDFYEFLLGSINESKKMNPEQKRKAIGRLSPKELQKNFAIARKRARELEYKTMELFINTDSLESEALDEIEEKKRARIFLQTPEIIFYLQVWIPCFLIYGIYPPYLLRKARHGDEDAIEKILRLDKSIIDDPKIKEIFHQASNAKKVSKFNLMKDAIQKAPKVRIEIQSIKYALAGLISVIFIALGQKLAAAEIHRLFDAIARDTGKGIIDDDLAVSRETFEKAIQRYRTFWQVIPKADRK